MPGKITVDLNKPNDKNETKDEISRKIAETAINLASLIPYVGDFIGFVGNTILSWLEPPAEKVDISTLPSGSDQYRIVKDFDIYDSLSVMRYNDSALILTDGTDVSISNDAATKLFKEKNYEQNQQDDFDFKIDQITGQGQASIVLSGFTFKSATTHFIKCLEASESGQNKRVV